MNAHIVYINGVELVYHEFKELLLELALRLKDQIDSAPGKLRSLIKKFLDEHFLRRLSPYIKFNEEKLIAEPVQQINSAARKWPTSEKDEAISKVLEEKKKKEAEEERLRQEELQRQAELAAQATPDQVDEASKNNED